jgi:hypothetical protein
VNSASGLDAASAAKESSTTIPTPSLIVRELQSYSDVRSSPNPLWKNVSPSAAASKMPMRASSLCHGFRGGGTYRSNAGMADLDKKWAANDQQAQNWLRMVYNSFKRS